MKTKTTKPRTCPVCDGTEETGATFYTYTACKSPSACRKCLAIRVAEYHKATRAFDAQGFIKHLKGRTLSVQTKRIYDWVREGKMNLTEFRGVVDLLLED